MSLRPLTARATINILRPTRLRLSTPCPKRWYATEALALAEVAVKPSVYGQPLHPSHPHLLKERELTPGIPTEEYHHRRRALIDALPPNSLVLCVAGHVKYMSGQIFYKFRQASDFWYLTGFEEPEAAVLLHSVPSSPRGYHMTLFHRLPDPAAAQWEGARTTSADLVSLFGADDALALEDLPAVLKKRLAGAECVYVDMPSGGGTKRTRTPTARSLLKYLTRSGQEHDVIFESLGNAVRRPLAPEVGRLRAVKSKAEQRVMRAAADISARAHAKTMRFAQSGMSEHVLAAHFEYLCARDGSQRPAYVPVVASGPNALTIHYTANNQVVRASEMVLIDAACEYNGYASDITRTFPASGSFTPAQTELYSAVLAAQKQLVALCSARERISLAQLHRRSVELLRAELARVGFNFGAAGGGARVEEVYPHFVGHPVGIDLHESSHFDRNAPLEPGMVITIEPGVYVPPLPHFPKHFHNMGIRIEDEVLVGENDPVVLSVNAPKEIVDVEGACQGLLGLEPF